MKTYPPGRRLSRREMLALAGAPLLAPGVALAAARPSSALSVAAIARSPGRVVPVDGTTAEGLDLVRSWKGSSCRPRLTNRGSRAARVREIVLFDVTHALSAETALYGEGFQMLSQTAGTLGAPAAIGDYTDAKHYRMPQPADAAVAYGLVTLGPPGGGHCVLAFASCRRFVGRFDLRPASIQVVVDTEGRELAPGETWELEEVVLLSGSDRDALLADLAARLNANHPPLRFPTPPSGWCSWYHFGPRVTAADVLANLEVIAKEVPGLRYIQVDDGYQPAMGDWLETGAAFGGDVQGVLAKIKERGFEPAIWVAPFIAEEQSRLFREHADWFVKAADGAPLRADRVTFGGWRRGPWYAVDGTHPGAQAHLEHVFGTMRERWGCTYFKLDANFWGAIHGGRFHDPRATRVDAYRRGMAAVRRGAGDAFILGCNHPIWPSLGEVHGSRSSNDIKRTWARIAGTARQNLERNWQNGRIWWNDPDAVVLTGDLPEDTFRFHAAVIHATGGMLLSGDDLAQISRPRLDLLRALDPPTGVPARFTDATRQVGLMRLSDRTVACLLNWDDAPRVLAIPLDVPSRVRDAWTGEDLGRHRGVYRPPPLAARSGRVLILTRA